MALALAFALYYGEGDAVSILVSMTITISVGFLLWRAFKAEGELRIRDAFAIVSFGWITIVLFGTVPYLFSGTFSSFTDALFESVSGFTTTGSSVLVDFDSVGPGILVWRSLTHWLGGLGIILMVLAIFPVLGHGGMQLYHASVSDISQEKLRPRIQNTARALFGVYLLITTLEITFLLFGRLSIFDALCTAFGTVATGGFSPRKGSIAAYNSLYVELVVMVFMFLSGINFALHFRALRGQIKPLLRDEDVRFFLILILISITVVFLDLSIDFHQPWGSALRQASFQVISLSTTTGYVTADYDSWRPFSRFLLLMLMFIGACPGSTSGAIKNMRVLIAGKALYREMRKLLHPQAVISLWFNGRPVADGLVQKVVFYILLYLSVFFVGSLLMMICGLDMVSALSSVAATLGGVGPGLGKVGPAANYASVPLLGKWVLCLCMLLGRLEMYALLLLFFPEFWKR
ncbi:MAG: TrkH family potassium uptake protein [bacterium]